MSFVYCFFWHTLREVLIKDMRMLEPPHDVGELSPFLSPMTGFILVSLSVFLSDNLFECHFVFTVSVTLSGS